MAKIYHYEQTSWGTHNKLKQEELQRMAKNIVSSCTFVEETHHGYGTNDEVHFRNDEEREKQWTNVLDGTACLVYKSESLPIRYFIHYNCGVITEIIEILEA